MNQRGMVLILTLPILGIIMTFLLGLTAGWAALHSEFQAAQICRSEVQSIQEKNKKFILLIRATNPLSVKLRIQKNYALARLAACSSTVNPCAIEAMAKLALINSKQKKLDSLQKALLESGKQVAELGILKTTQKMLANRNSISFEGIIRTQIGITKIENAGIALEPSDKDLAPVYNFPSDFIIKQRIAIQWKNNFLSNIQKSEWLHLNGRSTSACGASFDSPESLKIHLTKVRLSQNSWSF